MDSGCVVHPVACDAQSFLSMARGPVLLLSTTLLCFLSCIHLSTSEASMYTAVDWQILALEICFPTALHPCNPGQQAPAKALGSYYTMQAGGKQGNSRGPGVRCRMRLSGCSADCLIPPA